MSDFGRCYFTWKSDPIQPDLYYMYAGGFVGGVGVVDDVCVQFDATAVLINAHRGTTVQLFLLCVCRREYAFVTDSLSAWGRCRTPSSPPGTEPASIGRSWLTWRSAASTTSSSRCGATSSRPSRRIRGWRRCGAGTGSSCATRTTVHPASRASARG